MVSVLFSFVRKLHFINKFHVRVWMLSVYSLRQDDRDVGPKASGKHMKMNKGEILQIRLFVS